MAQVLKGPSYNTQLDFSQTLQILVESIIWSEFHKSAQRSCFKEFVPNSGLIAVKKVIKIKLDNVYRVRVKDLDKLNQVKLVVRFQTQAKSASKIMLASKAVKSDIKIIITLRQSKSMTHSLYLQFKFLFHRPAQCRPCQQFAGLTQDNTVRCFANLN